MPEKHSQQDILHLLADLDVKKVKLAVTDIDGVLRGKVISIEKFHSVLAKGFGFCDVIFGWDSADAAYDNAEITGWHTGYPDATALIDFSSFRRIPWEDGMPFFLADFRDAAGNPLQACPRSLLNKIATQVKDAGFTPFFSQEFEWFNMINSANSASENKFSDFKPMTTGMFGYSMLRAGQKNTYFNNLFDLLRAFDVPLEGLHTETGPGVYEAALAYCEVLEAADRAVLFKTGVKQIAHNEGLMATFMAKLNEKLPGCSGHVHQSLWSADQKQNLFYDKDKPMGISALMEQYIAGQLFTLPYILPFYAPTINSYKRLVEGAWAPTTITWGVDNRTTALRVLRSGSQSTRLETRVVGADANPYLAMAACLAGGLYGIRHRLTLDIPQTIGNGYLDTRNGSLPKNLWEATARMKESGIATELFGASFINHFTSTREWEWRQYSKAVTDWELSRYMEII